MLLQYLLQHRGRVLSRDLLLGDVWGYRYTGGTRTVDVHVRRLREKLPVLVDALVTVKQFGYKLVERWGHLTRAAAFATDPDAHQLPHESLRRRPSSPRRCRCWRWRRCCRGRCARSSARRIEQRLTDEARLIADLLSQATGTRRQRRSTPRPTGSGSSSRAASRSSPRTDGGRRFHAGRDAARHARKPRARPGDRRRARGGHRRQPALQHDGRHRHAVRRRARIPSGRALRAAGAAADRRRRAAGRDSDARRWSRWPRRFRWRCWSRGCCRRRSAAACRRSRASRDRYSAGDLSRRPTTTAPTSSATVARVLDASVQELGGRLEELSRDRARMEAILAGMVEGVLVVDRQGRLQLVNRAAQEMLRVDASGDRPAVPRSDPPSRHRGAAGTRRCAATRSAAGSWRSRAIRAGRSSRARRRCRGDRRRRRGAGAARHHRPAPRRSDPARLRRQRLARAADAADGDSRLRRGAARRAGRCRTARTGSSRSSRGTRRGWSGWSRTCCGWRGSTRGRRRSRWRAATCGRSSTAWSPIWRRRSRPSGSASSIDVPPEAAQVDGDPAKLHDIVRNLVENAVNYSPDGADVHARGAARDGSYTITVADSGPGIPPEDLTRVFERFYRVDKSRVAARRHRPRPGDRQASGGAARRRGARRERRRRRRRVHRDALP